MLADQIRSVLLERLEKAPVTLKEIAELLGTSSQYVSYIMKDLVNEGRVVKVGSTRNAKFFLRGRLGAGSLPMQMHKRLKNSGLEEHIVFSSVKKRLPQLESLKENVYSIFEYAFDEMMNNAIEHSGSEYIEIEVEVTEKHLRFIIRDSGVGAFQNIRDKKGLKSIMEAIRQLLKGKVTTVPHSHTGEGIFFTSRAADVFELESAGYRLRRDNTIPDTFIEQVRKRRGTEVRFAISSSSDRHLNDIFRSYQSDDNEYGFDKTEVLIRLYTTGTVYISRSQARRVLAGLDKFKKVILDFDRVETVGQAFADEVFRVFLKDNPDIAIEVRNTNEAVQFMVDRARSG